MKASSGRDQQSERYSYGVKARPSQVKVELKVMLPGYYEIVKTSFFPSGLFLESDNATCPPSRSRARVKLLAKQVLQARPKFYYVENENVENATSLVGESLCPSGLPCAVTETESMKMLKISSQNQTNKSM